MNTTTSVWRSVPPPRARRIRVTLTETQAEIDRYSDWSSYGGQTAVESYELVEEARQYTSPSGIRGMRPARYRAVFVVVFPAHAQSENAANSLCGVIRGLGGLVEEL